MPGKNHYRLYKDYKLYFPMGHDLLRDSAGRYAVYIVFSRPWSNTIERLVVPGCFANTLMEAEKLSIEHARRMIDERMPIEHVDPMSAERSDGEYTSRY